MGVICSSYVVVYQADIHYLMMADDLNVERITFFEKNNQTKTDLIFLQLVFQRSKKRVICMYP